MVLFEIGVDATNLYEAAGEAIYMKLLAKQYIH